VDSALDSIYELREKMESEEASTRLALRQIEEERDILQRRLEMIEDEREQILAKTRQQAENEFKTLQDEIRLARKKLRDAVSLNQLKKLGKEVEQIEVEQLQSVATTAETEAGSRKRQQKLFTGDSVLVRTLNVKGVVVLISKKEAVVSVGRLSMRASLDDLELLERPIEKQETEVEILPPIVSSPGIELDLRGRRVEDGLAVLDKHLDNAFLARLPWVRIIHGKGTGRLRDAVRKALRHNSHVVTWEEGKDGEGGAGVTVAKLVEHD
jgi:DNA mismatch repair protein MutS2